MISLMNWNEQDIVSLCEEGHNQQVARRVK